MNWDFLFKPEKREPSTEIRYGQQAERLANDPAFQRAIRSVREGIHLRWASSPVDDAQGQAKLRLLLKLLDDLELNIKHDLDSGSLATKQLEIEREREESKRKRRVSVFNLRR